jgi:hypothetical protein
LRIRKFEGLKVEGRITPHRFAFFNDEPEAAQLQNLLKRASVCEFVP